MTPAVVLDHAQAANVAGELLLAIALLAAVIVAEILSEGAK
jgi:hypothetical protein